jgi:hypothetical protein
MSRNAAFPLRSSTPPALPIEEPARIKGTAFRSTLAAIEKMYGAAGLRAVRAAMEPEERAALDQILAVGWYPVELSAALHVAARHVLGFGSWDVSRTLGHEAARIDYSGVYRVVIRAVQYDSVFSRLERTWRHYCTLGSFRWQERRPGCMRATIRDVRGFNEGMWLGVAGRTAELLRMIGSRAADCHVVDVDDRACTLEAMWLT